MNGCPRCGSALPEAVDSVGAYAPVWAKCRMCAWPLDRDAMIERLMASRASVVTVIRAGRDGSVVEALVGDQARSAIESLGSQPDALAPLCEAAGMLAYQRSGFTEIVLFEGENVQRALSAMAGR